MDVQHADRAVSDRAVVVGADGSRAALQAVRWAAAEAARRNAPLRVVTAFGWQPDHALGQAGLGAEYREVTVEVARRALAEAATLAEEVLAAHGAAGTEVERRLASAFPVPELQSESAGARLLVLGDRGIGGVGGLMVGSVTSALVAHAACPVVMVRTEEAVPVDAGPVVVGVDGSPVSEAAVEFAFEAAAVRGVPLVAVHTWWDLLLDPKTALLRDWGAIEADEREVLAERLARWAEKFPEVRVERVVVRDRPAHALVQRSRTAQLLVVGSHGRGAAARLLLGSVSHAVLHRSHCAVAVVRPPADERS